VKAALAVACDLASARREAARAASVAAADLDPDPSRSVIGRLPAFADTSAATNAAALAGYAPVPEAEAAALASAFRRARSYVLRVVESKLRIGAFPELAELRLRLDFNGFYGTDADATRGE
jgi:gamma-tubulin complex component 5